MFYLWEQDSRTFLKLNKSQVEKFQSDLNVLRLIDGDSNNLYGWRGIHILFASPGTPGINEFCKVHSSRYYLPIWTENELEICNDLIHGIDPIMLHENFNFFGGIPRFVFMKANELSQQKVVIEEKIDTGDALNIFNIIKTKRNVNESEYSHGLLQMITKKNTNFRAYTLGFASTIIVDKIFDKLIEDSYSRLTEFLATNLHATGGPSALKGDIFEKLVHRSFADNNESRILIGRCLHDENTFELVIKGNHELKRFTHLREIALIKSKCLYYRPDNKNFAAIDSIYWNGKDIYLLQMTISENHAIHHASITNIVEWCLENNLENSNIYFVFIVPSAFVERYNVQNYVSNNKVVHNIRKVVKDMKQYVVGHKII